ncbi:hypothetical protein YB2330_003008 [Saitoella coloradoensis]
MASLPALLALINGGGQSGSQIKTRDLAVSLAAALRETDADKDEDAVVSLLETLRGVLKIDPVQPFAWMRFSDKQLLLSLHGKCVELLERDPTNSNAKVVNEVALLLEEWKELHEKVIETILEKLERFLLEAQNQHRSSDDAFEIDPVDEVRGNEGQEGPSREVVLAYLKFLGSYAPPPSDDPRILKAFLSATGLRDMEIVKASVTALGTSLANSDGATFHHELVYERIEALVRTKSTLWVETGYGLLMHFWARLNKVSESMLLDDGTRSQPQHIDRERRDSYLNAAHFWRLLSEGLRSGLSLPQKLAMYILKRATALLPKLGYQHRQRSPEWSNFFDLYEILKEGSPHQLRPALIPLTKLLERSTPSSSTPPQDPRDATWATILLGAGLGSKSDASKRLLWKHLATTAASIKGITSEWGFLVDTLLTFADLPRWFAVTASGVCVHGNHVFALAKEVMSSQATEANEKEFMKRLVKFAAEGAQTAGMTTYLLLAIADYLVGLGKCVDEESAKLLKTIVTSNRKGAMYTDLRKELLAKLVQSITGEQVAVDQGDAEEAKWNVWLAGVNKDDPDPESRFLKALEAGGEEEEKAATLYEMREQAEKVDEDLAKRYAAVGVFLDTTDKSSLTAEHVSRVLTCLKHDVSKAKPKALTQMLKSFKSLYEIYPVEVEATQQAAELVEEMYEMCSIGPESVFKSAELCMSFIDAVYGCERIMADIADEELYAVLVNTGHDILETGRNRRSIVPHLVKRLAEFWVRTYESDRGVAVASLSYFQYLIYDIFSYDPFRGTDEKLEITFGYILDEVEHRRQGASYEKYYGDHDVMAKARLIDVFARLETADPYAKEFAEGMREVVFAHALKPKFLAKVYHENQVEHRLKLSQWRLVILLDRFMDEDAVEGVLDNLLHALSVESMPSVKCFIEWAIVRVACLFPALDLIKMKVWALFTEGKEELRPHVCISLINIGVVHARVAPEDVREQVHMELIENIMSFTCTNRSALRHHAACSFLKIWQDAEKLGMKSITSTSAFAKTAEYCATSPQYTSIHAKYAENWYLTEFDPVKDYTLAVMWHKMVRLCDPTETERIQPSVFERIGTDDRREVKLGADEFEEVAGEVVEAEPTKAEEEASGALQSKSGAWDTFLEENADAERDTVKDRSSIIVVASLISQKPNLAGICRTAEIMRAELLCLDDITVAKTAGFQSVSVSSEVWMPLHEVKESHIKDFLREKKAEGYTIIALEQSSSSVVLGTYAFPEKCVLLLGREKEGVDADLLVEVDQVIEIPQYGYTRSLNVHVSASLLLYEYTKQIRGGIKP